ncbi:PD-(D/E)XK motif protein [Streptomyces sp. NPDC091268]|uniref:PD-(D/E)XK motif protein n=1 Tax=Streptomyces sp. NPDC091268 TaxID=3365979 RepID=UPI003825E6D0
MNEDALRKLIEDRWIELESARTTGERRLRIAALPIVVDHGPLAVGVDHDGHRHVLVPIPAGRKVRPGLDGSGLQLRKRALEDAETYQVYADLACRREDLGDLFTELCVEVLETVESLPENPVKGLYRVLDRWSALFRPQGSLLGPEQQAGLFGELLVLQRLLAKDSSAHRLWRGPEGHRHDLVAGKTAVEVKASTREEGRRPRIHGLDQLEAPAGGTLTLVWFRLVRTTGTDAGMALVELIENMLHLCDDEGAFLASLARAGYQPSGADLYHDVRFIVDEERWYRVDDAFPGLTGQALAEAGIPVSVQDVTYSIDLSGEAPGPLTPAEVERTIDDMIQGFA